MDAWTIYIYPILLQFINAAISEDVMIVNNLLESSIAGVKSTKCIGPWKVTGRNVRYPPSTNLIYQCR